MLRWPHCWGTTFVKQVEPIAFHRRRPAAAPAGRGQRRADEPAAVSWPARSHPGRRHRRRYPPAGLARPGGRAGHRPQYRGPRLQPAAGRGLYAQPAGQRHLRQRLAAGLVPEQRTARPPGGARAAAPGAVAARRGHRRRRLGLALPMGRLHAGRARPDRFPHRKFGRIVSALWRNPPPDLLTYAHGGGLPALRARRWRSTWR